MLAYFFEFPGFFKPDIRNRFHSFGFTIPPKVQLGIRELCQSSSACAGLKRYPKGMGKFPHSQLHSPI